MADIVEKAGSLTSYQDASAENNSQLEAGAIQAIDKESVHRICSGQVVLTLATAVKELVENSIDAGATTVDIRLKEYGSESIEVTDNGSGVEEKNFAGLTQKHHTSKLSDFSDLTSVATFGFRGEALSSLCALSLMTITTRHKSAVVGTKLEYDNNGLITSSVPSPRQQGTTVSLQNLFHTLPVRHKEFQRNLKKEFSKMVQVLNAYCLINTGVRITCSNQTNKGSRSIVVSTNGNPSVKDNIANVFGPKQLQSLLAFEQRSPSADVCADYGIQSNAGHSDIFSIEGYVSKCEHGQGRSSTDRQFLFINKRPCDASKILKVINEVYHSYNRHQYPFVTLLITMAKESVDVNVTPDKRQIFVEGEKLLLATVKSSLTAMFEPTTSVLRVNVVPHQSGSYGTLKDTSLSGDKFADSDTSPDKLSSRTRNGEKDGGLSSLARLKRSFSSAFDKGDRTESSPSTPQHEKQRKLETFLNKSHSTPAKFSADKGSIASFFKTSSSPLSPVKKTQTSESSPENESSPKEVVFIEHCPADKVRAKGDDYDKESEKLCGEESVGLKNGADTVRSPVKIVFHEGNSAIADQKVSVEEETAQRVSQSEHAKQTGCSYESFEKSVHQSSVASFANHKHSPDEHDETDSATCIPNVVKTHQGQESGESSDVGGRELIEARSQLCQVQEEEGYREESGSNEGQHSAELLALTYTQLDVEEHQARQETTLPFSFSLLQECLRSPEMESKKKPEKEFSRSFRAKICPSENESAEEELQREISKDMFAKMSILGQFNLGFIVTKNGEDLFIIDQHATDEKYNFEMLQQHTMLQSQQLIHPQSLELTASNEVILMDNLDIFKKNGFDFVIDEDAPPTQRVKLKSTPMSKNWSFGKDDIEELLFMLMDSPGVMCRPSRVRMMFASRACRKSIMIGTPLNKSEMKKLVCHMGEIEQPWNCPHGRPTMRHLINLNMLPR